MDAAQKARLNELSVWKRQRFPNGSDYKQQELPSGNYGDVTIRTVYNQGYFCDFPGETVRVSFHRQSVGNGADLGVHFNTRDQALIDLL